MVMVRRLIPGAGLSPVRSLRHLVFKQFIGAVA